MNGAWYDAGTSAAISVVDNPAMGGNDNGIADEWDVYAHDLVDAYYRFFPLDQPEPLWPSSAEGEHHYHMWTAFLPELLTEVIYVLTDYNLNYTFLSSVQSTQDDPWFHYDMEGYQVYPSIRNQVDWDGTQYVRHVPFFQEFRGVEKWGGILAINWPFPDPYDYQCLSV